MNGPLWLPVGALALAGGAAGVAVRARNQPLFHRVLAVGPSMSAAAWYLLGIAGVAITETAAGSVFWGRYADGIVTIPLLTVGLATLAGAPRRSTTVATVLAAASMAATLGATLATGAQKLVLTVLAALLFGGVLWMLVGPLAPDTATRGIRRLRAYVVTLWLTYPVLWALSPAGLAIGPGLPLTWPAVVLDVLLKVGWGYLFTGIPDGR
ncbi:MAG: bacteriorhodopsin [Halobacteriaceae archaeon]